MKTNQFTLDKNVSPNESLRKIIYENKSVDILQFISESENQFQQRLEYIKTIENKNIIWKEANRLSKVWYCIKFKKCKYSPELYNYITRQTKNK
jgi:hypothetical protein